MVAVVVVGAPTKMRKKIYVGIFLIMSFVPFFSDMGTAHAASILENLTGKPSSDPYIVTTLIINLTNLLFTLVGIGAVLMVIWGGFSMVTSAGDPEKVKRAKTILTAAVVGLAIVIASKGIVLFLTNTIGGMF